MPDTGNCLPSFGMGTVPNPGNKSFKINSNVFTFLEVGCCKRGFSYPKSLPGTLAPSIPILSTLAFIFGAFPSWSQGGCCSPRCHVCIPGRNWEKTGRVTPVSGRQEFSEKSRDRHLHLYVSVARSAPRGRPERQRRVGIRTGLGQLLQHGAGKGTGCKVVGERISL